MNTVTQTHNAIGRAIKAAFAIDVVVEEVEAMRDGTFCSMFRAETYNRHGQKALYRANPYEEDDDHPQFVGRDDVYRVACEAAKETGAKITGIYDAEKYWFDVRFRLPQ